MHSMYLVSLKRPCGSLKVTVQETWLGDVRSGTPSTSETGTTGGLLHRSPELYWARRMIPQFKKDFLHMGRDSIRTVARIVL